MTDKDKLDTVSALLRELLRATRTHKGWCILCGATEHVGHMECPAEAIEDEYKKLSKK